MRDFRHRTSKVGLLRSSDDAECRVRDPLRNIEWAQSLSLLIPVSSDYGEIETWNCTSIRRVLPGARMQTPVFRIPLALALKPSLTLVTGSTHIKSEDFGA